MSSRPVVSCGSSATATRSLFEGDKTTSIAAYIDQTLLRADATMSDIHDLCDGAREAGFATVCVNPVFVKPAVARLEGSSVEVGTVAGFPLGADLATVKANETRAGIAAGAREIDMVINLGAFKGGDHDLVRTDIEAVAAACREADAVLKVIIETAVLTDAEKVTAARLCKEAGVGFVKTSSGFASGGATISDVALLRATVGEEMGVKASGGIRTYNDAMAMIKAGATRIGTSTGVAILTGEQRATGAKGA